LGIGDIWENGRNNDKDVWVRISKRCDIESHSIEVTIRERSSLTLYKRLRSNREKEVYTELHTREE
jgi:hypothetical protein